MPEHKAKNNRTLELVEEEIPSLRERLLTEEKIKSLAGEASVLKNEQFINKTLNGDLLKVLKFLPDGFADLIIIDPPYNLTKNFSGLQFNSRSDESYDQYLESWFPDVCKKLKPNGSLYMCGDWKCTSSLQRAIEKELTIMNRITWQRASLKTGRAGTKEISA